MIYQITAENLALVVVFSVLGGALVSWIIVAVWYEIKYRKHLSLARNQLRKFL